MASKIWKRRRLALLTHLLGGGKLSTRQKDRRRVLLRLEELESRLTPSSMFSITGGSAVEPTGSGTASIQFTVTRSGGANSQVTIGYTTVDGSATANRDYLPTTGTVTFPAGATTEPIDVPIFDNGVYNNPNLTFSVELTGITNVQGPPATFGAQNNAVSTSSPVSVTVADVNGDGKPDLVVTYFFNDSVSVLLNTTAPGAATPTFAAPVNTSAGLYPNTAAVADVNGDGLPDLVVLNQGDGGGYVSVLLNTTANGVLSFAPPSSQSTFAIGSNPTSLAVADLNGDGAPDLVVSSGYATGTVTVLLNTTTKGATAPSFSASTYSVGAYPNSVAAADLNGDGKPDLVVANGGSGDVSVLANTTTAGVLSFAPPQTLAVGSIPVSVAVADLNGDGAPDLVVANYWDDTVSVLVNTTAPGSTTPTFASQTTFAVGSYPASVAVADLNGDGKPDIVVANSKYDNYSISVLLNTTTPGAAAPTFAPQATIATTPAPLSVVTADLNGDGAPDLVITASYGQGDPFVATLTNTTVLDVPQTITQPTAVGTIIESDPPPTVQFNAASETVDASTGVFSITVGLSAVSGADTTIPFTLSGTAVNGTDYIITTASPLVIPAGQTTGTISGTLFNDSSSNATKTLTFTLGTPTNATLGAATTNTLTIQDSSAVGILTLAPDGFQVTNNVPRVAVGVPFQQGGYFTDASNEPVTAVITWGDGSITTAPVVVANQVGRFVTNHVYTQQGSYPLSAVIEDGQGQIVAAGALSGPVQVVPDPFGPVNVVFGVPGQTVTQFVTDPSTGTIIEISLTVPAGDPAGGYLLVTQLIGAQPTGAYVTENIASFDIRQFDLPADATATVTLIVSGGLPTGTTGQLFFLDQANPANPMQQPFQGRRSSLTGRTCGSASISSPRPN